MPYPRGNPVTQELIDWADLIIAMEPAHSQHLRSHFKLNPDKIRILNIADIYYRDDPELISILRKKVPRMLQEYFQVKRN